MIGAIFDDPSQPLADASTPSGAYLAVQSAIAQPAGTFGAVIAGYGMLDMRSPWFTTQRNEKHPLGNPTLPPSLVDDHLAAMEPGQVVSAATPPVRADLALATVQYGRYPDMLGDEAAVYPLEMLGSVKTFPPLFIYHGTEDSAVEVRQTEAFVEKLKDVLPGAKVLVRFEHGDHGFDAPVGLEVPWLKEGLEFVAGEWLGRVDVGA